LYNEEDEKKHKAHEKFKKSNNKLNIALTGMNEKKILILAGAALLMGICAALICTASTEEKRKQTYDELEMA